MERPAVNVAAAASECDLRTAAVRRGDETLVMRVYAGDKAWLWVWKSIPASVDWCQQGDQARRIALFIPPGLNASRPTLTPAGIRTAFLRPGP